MHHRSLLEAVRLVLFWNNGITKHVRNGSIYIGKDLTN
jgi:hypothetical protein